MSIEVKVNPNLRVIPIFGNHTTDVPTVFALGQIIAKGEFPQRWLWSSSTIKRIQKMEPSFMALDGLYAQVKTDRLLFYSPGNPYDLHPPIYVGAEPPWVKFLSPNPRESVAEQAIRLHWNKISGGTAEDPNQVHLSSRMRDFVKVGLAEFGILFFIMVAADYLSGSNPTVNFFATSLWFTDLARFIINRSILKRVHHLFDYQRYIAINRLTRPLFLPSRHLDIRNALAAIKLAEVRETHPDHTLTGPAVAIFGPNHANGVNLWNDDQKQRKVIDDTIVEVFGLVEKLAKRRKIEPTPQFHQDVARGINRFFAETSTWVFGKKPQRMDIKSITRQVSRKTFLSPTITQIVEEVSKNF